MIFIVSFSSPVPGRRRFLLYPDGINIEPCYFYVFLEYFFPVGQFEAPRLDRPVFERCGGKIKTG